MKASSEEKQEHYQQNRRRAEQLLEALDYKPETAGSESTEAAALVQDLMVSHIELELQQDEIFSTREQLEAALAESSRFFDLAPFAYMQLDRTGVIHRCNLAGCELLGVPRNRFTPGKLPISLLLASESQIPVYSALRDSFNHGKPSRCRAVLANGSAAVFTTSAPIEQGGQPLLLAALVLL